MPKADAVHSTPPTNTPAALPEVNRHTPAGAGGATSSPPVPTRRAALMLGLGAAGSVAAAPGLPALAAPVPPDAASDPVVTLYTRWKAAMDAQAIVSKRASRLRAILVARHGEVLAAGPKWDADSDHGELRQAIKECDALTETITNLIEAMMALPATSLAGLRCKMEVGADLFRFAEGGAKVDDEVALAFMRDAVRLLTEAGAV